MRCVRVAANQILLPLLLLLLHSTRACWSPPETWATRVAPPWPLLDAERQGEPSEQLLHAGIPWLAWLGNTSADACIRNAMALRLEVASGTEAGDALIHIARALSTNASACNNASTVAWLASGPWCPLACNTSWTRFVRSMSLLEHAAVVSGSEVSVAIVVSVVILCWSVLCALLIFIVRGVRRCCGCMGQGLKFCCAKFCCARYGQLHRSPYIVDMQDLQFDIDDDDEPLNQFASSPDASPVPAGASPTIISGY